jgi:3-methyladenine DNA glycosylase AlkD
VTGAARPAAVLTAAAVKAAINEAGDPERAASSAWFFKTGPGQYGAGDRFAGVSVPAQRAIAKRFRGLGRRGVKALLGSDVHEHRLTGLFLLRSGFESATDEHDRRAWVDLYLAAVHEGRVNNWDLVDSSADCILGRWILRNTGAQGGQDHSLLFELASEPDLWCRRVAVMATFAFIKSGDGTTILALAPTLLDDRRDLIQKAIGWMLRETGKRVDRQLLLDFLDEHAAEMGRTALSYATEHLTAEQRAHYRSLR